MTSITIPSCDRTSVLTGGGSISSDFGTAADREAGNHWVDWQEGARGGTLATTLADESIEAEVRAWADLASAARTNWAEENPY